MAIQYPIGTTRIVSRLVIHKRIGDEVKLFQVCTWEEQYQVHVEDDIGGGVFWKNFTPTKFVPRQLFEKAFLTTQ